MFPKAATKYWGNTRHRIPNILSKVNKKQKGRKTDSNST
jgi:hypothetical protein